MSKYPNIIQCLECKMILVSFNRHDYKTCSCPNRTMIDGGHTYLRCGGKDLSKILVLKIIKRGRLFCAKKTVKNSIKTIRKRKNDPQKQ